MVAVAVSICANTESEAGVTCTVTSSARASVGAKSANRNPINNVARKYLTALGSKVSPWS